MKKKQIAVCVSGGVDSLYALWTLRNEGHDIIALHGKFTDKSDGLELLNSLCTQWSIPLYILDLKAEFEANVIKPFVEAYTKAYTPNPCAFCNNSMKFGLLYEKAKSYNAEYIATGHYVQVYEKEHTVFIKKGEDNTKEQSYFLALTQKNVLQKAIFPLGKEKKQYIRKVLAENNIPVPVPQESQEICFVSEEERLSFIEAKALEYGYILPQEGSVFLKGTEEEKQIFSKQKHRHSGLWKYTEGQRKGLGISWKEPLYVLGKDMGQNGLIVGSKEKLQVSSCVGYNPNFFLEYENWTSPLFVQTRFRQIPREAQVEFDKALNLFYVHFAKQEDAIAPGQVLAIYDKDYRLLAGAILQST